MDYFLSFSEIRDMGIQVIFLLFLLFEINYAAEDDCTTFYCANSSFIIRFPFWFESQQPQNCKNPGFNLSCNNQGPSVLNLPYSGQFYVQNIYYYIGRIQLSDPDNCLPRRLLSLNLSFSPFTAVSYQDYTFLSCPINQSTGLTTAIDCLSNSTTSILATTSQSEVMRLYMCKKIITLPVPVSSQFEYKLPLNLELTWNVSAFENRRPVAGVAKPYSVFRIITVSILAMAIIIPALIIFLSCCICAARRQNRHARDTIPTSSEVALSADVAPGLDESTIESYQKVTLGESQRIPGPNGITCAICLADYGPTEIVKLMPECEHCFHVECIDKWLRMSSNCPICRRVPY